MVTSEEVSEMAWQAMQLMRDAERTELWYVSNDSHLAPRAFDDKVHGNFVPRWGSTALLHLAIQARVVHLNPKRVELRDVSLMPLDHEIAERASESIVEALRSDDLDAAEYLLDGPGGPYVVMSVELESEDGARVVVERYGGFEVTEDEPIPALVSAARTLLSIS
ncbi:hypothetical protein [Microbacterium esteraromaticum]|uniref:hypothetical protein n=1 Tax=Microbacterium esteraromaticum TaxID=57043 RepID=UPI0019595642|nr:hypothetical protein [Microbacterium esteraromaticum]MBM7466077.1 hypothetical protein [Microbacterium esteraromaticum]